ncbi:ATP-binding protein [Streptomyces sp. NBC_00306]|uniref:ATP-binding protein n=1 Tax=Streptomyces sp. NBC_00306 TaxID=2975708 RepID=UPI002E28B5C6|nr:ATP-binding protein [Streptomyces sp. NBC_00306]
MLSPLAAAAVTYEWFRKFEAQPNTPQLARLHGRTRLTMARWPGNQEAAVVVAGLLTANAVVHANPGPLGDRRCLSLRLTVTEDDELLIDVSDPLPQFPDFAAAVAGERGRGLWQVARLGCDLSWFLTGDGDGKVVRARMTVGRVPA